MSRSSGRQRRRAPRNGCGAELSRIGARGRAQPPIREDHVGLGPKIGQRLALLLEALAEKADPAGE